MSTHFFSTYLFLTLIRKDSLLKYNMPQRIKNKKILNIYFAFFAGYIFEKHDWMFQDYSAVLKIVILTVWLL